MAELMLIARRNTTEPDLIEGRGRVLCHPKPAGRARNRATSVEQPHAIALRAFTPRDPKVVKATAHHARRTQALGTLLKPHTKTPSVATQTAFLVE